MAKSLPSFKNRPIRMYVFLGLHLLFVSGIIISSCLPKSATEWMNETASAVFNNVINFIKGVKAVYPESIEIGEHTRTLYSYCFDDGKYHIKSGNYFNVEIKEIFKEDVDESLKFKKLNIRTSYNDPLFFETVQNSDTGYITIHAVKPHKDNYINVTIPESNKAVTINFDIEDSFVPNQENIYVSNTNPKLSSSFYINSQFLEPYHERIINDGYTYNPLLDSINGGHYYSARNTNVFYRSPISETHILPYLDLSNHHYLADDPHIEIDEQYKIVKINEGTTPGPHKITSTLGGEVSFVVSDQFACPIDIDELSINDTQDYVCPGQNGSGYIGQTITLRNSEILAEHALIAKSQNEKVFLVDIKKNISDGVYSFENKLFLRGVNAGKSSLDVHLYDNPDVKLNYSVNCDEMEKLFNYQVELFTDDKLIDTQVIEINKRYKFDVKIHHLDSNTYSEPTLLDISNLPSYYQIEKEDGQMYITFKCKGQIPIPMSYHFNGTYVGFRIYITAIDPNKSAVSNIDPKALRKSLGHALMHLCAALFLILFLNEYLKDKWNPLFNIGIAAANALLLATLSELIQLLIPGRYFGGLDILINFGGAFIAVLIMLIIHLVKLKKKKSDE